MVLLGRCRSGAAQDVGYILRMLCAPKWPSNFVKSSPEVAQVVEVTFSLKDNPRLSDFITKASLKDSGLAPIRGPQMAFIASPSIVVPPLVGDASLEAATGLDGCLNAA